MVMDMTRGGYGDLSAELRRTNAGSHLIIHVWRPQWEVQPLFHRLFICVDAIKK